MNIIFNTSKSLNKATEGMKSIAHEKFSTLEKFLKEDEPVKITVESTKKDFVKVKAQVVLKDNCRLRSECEGNDFYVVINNLKDSLKEQIVRHKERHSRKEKTSKFRKEVTSSMLTAETEELLQEYLPKVVKTKYFVLEPITQVMAVNEMEKLGHEQFVFKNLDLDNKICMIYKRFDEDYSMIVIEN